MSFLFVQAFTTLQKGQQFRHLYHWSLQRKLEKSALGSQRAQFRKTRTRSFTQSAGLATWFSRITPETEKWEASAQENRTNSSSQLPTLASAPFLGPGRKFALAPHYRAPADKRKMETDSLQNFWMQNTTRHTQHTEERAGRACSSATIVEGKKENVPIKDTVDRSFKKLECTC